MTIKSIQTLVNEAMQEIKTISADDAFNLLEGNDCNLIDIREPSELEMTGSLENSINIPRSHLEFQFETLVQNGIIDINKETVLFCAAGGRSALAVNTLMEMGFDNVSHIEGGFGLMKQKSFKIKT